MTASYCSVLPIGIGIDRRSCGQRPLRHTAGRSAPGAMPCAGPGDCAPTDASTARSIGRTLAAATGTRGARPTCIDLKGVCRWYSTRNSHPGRVLEEGDDVTLQSRRARARCDLDIERRTPVPLARSHRVGQEDVHRQRGLGEVPDDGILVVHPGGVDVANPFDAGQLGAQRCSGSRHLRCVGEMPLQPRPPGCTDRSTGRGSPAPSPARCRIAARPRWRFESGDARPVVAALAWPGESPQEELWPGCPRPSRCRPCGPGGPSRPTTGCRWRTASTACCSSMNQAASSSAVAEPWVFSLENTVG